jgi:DNA-directed RNA polymerase specialized sigma24 family protein
MVQEELDRRLQNWAWWTAWGTIGPEVRTRCSSAEGNYESEDVFEGPDPKYEPDLLDGEILENAIRVLPDISRRVLKAVYVQYPYHRRHNVAQRLRISVDRLEAELHTAKRRLSEQLQRDTAGNRGMAEGPPGVRDCLTSQ